MCTNPNRRVRFIPVAGVFITGKRHKINDMDRVPNNIHLGTGLV